MGFFIVESSPGPDPPPGPSRKRKIWELNDEGESTRRTINDLMTELFTDLWLLTDLSNELFGIIENIRQCIAESARYVEITRQTGLNDEFRRVIGEGKDITREKVIETFKLLPDYLRPRRVNLTIAYVIRRLTEGGKEINNFCFL